jgi:hypothetical protein
MKAILMIFASQEYHELNVSAIQVSTGGQKDDPDFFSTPHQP